MFTIGSSPHGAGELSDIYLKNPRVGFYRKFIRRQKMFADRLGLHVFIAT
jgi:hypothetical protein